MERLQENYEAAEEQLRFPEDPLTTIRAMLGIPTFAASLKLDDIEPATQNQKQRLLVIGGCVVNPTQGNVAHTPSVAAIVYNRGLSETHVSGSVRIQATPSQEPEQK